MFENPRDRNDHLELSELFVQNVYTRSRTPFSVIVAHMWCHLNYYHKMNFSINSIHFILKTSTFYVSQEQSYSCL